MIFRRHDRYYLRPFLGALVGVLAFLSALIVVYDYADRLADLEKVRATVEARGESLGALLVEYYFTLLPFVWSKLLPFAALIAAGFTFTWLARQNELSPIVAAGVPTIRLVAPILATAVVVAALQSVARETVIPTWSRRHDDLHRLLSRRARDDKLSDVPHLFDRNGARISIAAYASTDRRMEGVWVTFRRRPSATGPRDEIYFFPTLDWDGGGSRWIAARGGSHCMLEPGESGANTVSVPARTEAPITVKPALVELTVRQGAALGFSSAEIRALAEAYDDNPRFRVLFHQQWAAPVVTIVLLLLGLPLIIRLGRPRVFRSFLNVMSVVALYYMTDSVLTDVGCRGALNPLVAAWGAHVLFGALGLVLMTTLET